MQFRFRTRLLCAAFLSSLVLAPGQALAAQEGQQATIALDMPAQPLDRAVTEVARRSGLTIGGKGELLRGKRAPALHGEFTPAEALGRLLAGSGITYSFADTTTVRLGRASGANEQRLAPITVEGGRAQPWSGETSGYTTAEANAATRTPTPIAETPASVQVVPRDVIEDQAAQGIEDVYINVSGVVESGNTLNAQSEVLPLVRGFESPVLLRNGLRTPAVGALDLVAVESVEVLKGPASILYGQLQPGGVVNYNTELPQREPAFEIGQQAGSYDYLRTTIDATGALSAEGDWMYRVNAAYTDSDSFRDHLPLERVALAPSLRYRPSPRTDVILDLSYSREEVPYDSGVPFGADDEPLVEPDTFFGEPGLDGRDLEDSYASLRTEHRLGEVWLLRNQIQYHRVNALNEGLRNRGVGGDPGEEMLARRYQNQDSRDENYQLVTEAVAAFDALGANHTALMGLDLVYRDSENRRFRESLAPIPVGDDPPRGYTPPANQPKEVQLADSEWIAGYVQDQITVGAQQRLHVLVGTRFDSVQQTGRTVGEGPEQETDDEEFTARAGVLYEWTDWASPYLSYSQSFVPNSPSQLDPSGRPLPPEEGRQYEAGVKFRWFDERLVATLALYDIEKGNVAVFDSDFFDDTGQVAFIPGVRQASRGAELDVAGRLGANLDLIANYAYTDTETLENRADPSEEGEVLGNVPRHTARLFLKYSTAYFDTPDKVSLHAGARYASARRALFDPELTLDDFVTFEAGGAYRKALAGGRSLAFRVNLINLFDEEYYRRASDRSIVHPARPFTVVGSVGLRF